MKNTNSFNTKRRHVLLAGGAVALGSSLGVSTTTVRAQAYPDKPIKVATHSISHCAKSGSYSPNPPVSR
jgi:hypothetical protein